MKIFDLLGITVAFIMVIIVEIIMCKDKRIKNNDYDNETITKLRMIHMTMRLCMLIYFVILLVDYLLFFKII